MGTLSELFALSHLFVSGGVGYVRELPELPAQYAYKWDQNRAANPLGTFAAGYLWEPRPDVVIKLGYRHQSFIFVDDVGQDSIQFEVTWRPFNH